MKKKIKQLIALLFTTTIVVAALPVMETKAAEMSVTIATATNAQTEYKSEPITIKGHMGADTYGLSADKGVPIRIQADLGYVITKIEAIVGHISTGVGSVTLTASSGSVSPSTFERDPMINGTITIANINSASVTLSPSFDKAGASIQLKEFTVYYIPKVDSVDPTSTPAHTHSYSWKTLLAPTTEQDGVEALACTVCGDLKATQPISATGYALDVNAQVIDLAGSGAPVIVDLGRYNVLPRWFVKKLVSRPDLNITLKITYNHQNYVLEVPKTAIIEDESIEWYGPLKLMSMFPQK